MQLDFDLADMTFAFLMALVVLLLRGQLYRRVQLRLRRLPMFQLTNSFLRVLPNPFELVEVLALILTGAA